MSEIKEVLHLCRGKEFHCVQMHEYDDLKVVQVILSEYDSENINNYSVKTFMETVKFCPFCGYEYKKMEFKNE